MGKLQLFHCFHPTYSNAKEFAKLREQRKTEELIARVHYLSCQLQNKNLEIIKLAATNVDLETEVKKLRRAIHKLETHWEEEINVLKKKLQDAEEKFKLLEVDVMDSQQCLNLQEDDLNEGFIHGMSLQLFSISIVISVIASVCLLRNMF